MRTGGNGVPEGKRELAAMEREVVSLREDCVRLLDELERRYQRIARVPRKIGAGTLRVERGLVSLVRDHKLELAIGAALIVSGLGALAYRERRRSTSLSDRIVALLDEAAFAFSD